MKLFKLQFPFIFIVIMVFHIHFSNIYSNTKQSKKLTNNEYLAYAEEMPQPIDGLPALYKTINYPEHARKAGIEGKVYLLLFIDESGVVRDIKILKGVGGGCDEAAVKAVTKTQFIPAKNKGVPVKVKLSLSIEFKLK